MFVGLRYCTVAEQEMRKQLVSRVIDVAPDLLPAASVAVTPYV